MFFFRGWLFCFFYYYTLGSVGCISKGGVAVKGSSRCNCSNNNNSFCSSVQSLVLLFELTMIRFWFSSCQISAYSGFLMQKRGF